MYGLLQAGLIANELLEKWLNKHGYRQSKLVPGLWKHDIRPIQFTLLVDNFGVKYVGGEHDQHLKNTLEEHYKLTCDWTGTRYIGITLDWEGLQQTTSALVNAKLCEESTETIPTHSWQTTSRTVSKRPNSIWCQETICNTKIDSTFGKWQSQTVHTTGIRKILIPWQSSGQHPARQRQKDHVRK